VEDTLDAFQQIVGGPIEAGCYLPQRVMLVCNSEGKNMGLAQPGESYGQRGLHRRDLPAVQFRGRVFCLPDPQQKEFEAYFATSGPEGDEKD
jgi:hypothetical protein